MNNNIENIIQEGPLSFKIILLGDQSKEGYI